MTPRSVAALTASLMLFCAASSLHAEVYSSDVNKDGEDDAWTYVKNGYLQKQEIDMNYDGKVDAVFIYDSSGRVVREILDTDYDGNMDNWREYENGELVLDQVDSSGDGRIDLWLHVDRGRIYKMERDTTGDGSADEVVRY